MKTVFTVAGGLALCIALAVPRIASAGVSSPALLLNGSLECTLTPDQFNLVTASPTQNSNALSGWTITGGTIDVVPNTYWQANAGAYSVDLIGSPGLGGISQQVATTIGFTYTLTFDMAINPETITGEGASTKHLVVAAMPLSGPADGTMTFNGTRGTRTKTNMEYIPETFQFVASSTETTLSLSATMPSGLAGTFNASNTFCGPVIDNLVLVESGSTPAPEPASLALLGAGGMVLLVRRSRRGQAAGA